MCLLAAVQRLGLLAVLLSALVATSPAYGWQSWMGVSSFSDTSTAERPIVSGNVSGALPSQFSFDLELTAISGLDTDFGADFSLHLSQDGADLAVVSISADRQSGATNGNFGDITLRNGANTVSETITGANIPVGTRVRLTLNIRATEVELTISDQADGSILAQRIAAISGAASANEIKLMTFDNEGRILPELVDSSYWQLRSTRSGVDATVRFYGVDILNVSFAGDGTAVDPYQVGSPEGLDAVRYFPYAHFILIEDIDLNKAPFNEGAGWQPISDFSGHFDGNGHRIENLMINRPDEEYVGLFKTIKTDGQIRDCDLGAGRVIGKGKVGALTGSNYGDINGIRSFVFVSAAGEGIFDSGGGLVGVNWPSGTVRNSESFANTSGFNRIGGLIGENQGNVLNCKSSGLVSGTDDYVGGIVGFNGNGGSLHSSFSSATVSGKDVVGGAVGFNNEGSSITSCFSNGKVLASGNWLGGLCGENYGLINQSYSTALVEGDPANSYQLGGLAGRNHENASVVASFAHAASISGKDYLGGLIGINVGSVTESVSAGDLLKLDFEQHTNYVGGLVGGNLQGVVEKSAATGSVRGSYAMYPLGGFVGYNWGGDISESWCAGPIVDNAGALQGGGFSGLNSGSIQDCYSLSSGGGRSGAFAFNNYAVEEGTRVYGIIGNSFSTGQGNSIEGFLKTETDSQFYGTVNNCFALEISSGGNVETSLTVAEMQTASTYTAAGWDFTNIWTIDEGSSYPYFRDRDYTVTVTLGAGMQGTVTGGGTFYQADEITITATPIAGERFSHWEADGAVFSEEATFTFPAYRNLNLEAHFEPDTTSLILVDTVPVEGSLIQGVGIYPNGSTVILNAPDLNGYVFSHWSDDDAVLSSESSLSIVADGDRTLTAHYAWAITLEANIPEYGTVSGGGVFEYDDTVTLEAVPASMFHHFINWTEGGVEVSADPVFSFNATGSRHLVANFAINDYAITVDYDSSKAFARWNSNFNGGAYDTFYFNFSPGWVGYFNDGDRVTVKCYMSAGYSFVNWTEDGVEVSTSASYTFTASADRDLVANFAINQYTLDLASVPSGAATLSGAGTFDYNTSVTLGVDPAAGYHFLNWTKDGAVVSDDPNYTFNLTGNLTLKANFYQHAVTTTSSDESVGSVTGGGKFLDGDTVTLKATTTAAFHHFVNWTEGGVEVSTDPTYTFSASADRDLVANFDLNQYTLDLDTAPPGAATLTGAGTYDHGTSVTLGVDPAPSYHFLNWTEAGEFVSSELDYALTLTGGRTLTANFYQHAVTATSSDEGVGSVSGGGKFLDGDTVTLEATTTAAFHHFVNWTEGGVEVSTDPNYTFTATVNRSLVANFSANEFLITPEVNVEGRGSVTVTALHDYGSTVVLTAAPAEGFMFVRWREGNTTLSTDEVYSFEFTQARDRTLVADFVHEYAGGSGSEEDPYLVATPEQLDDIRFLLDKHFKQIADIDLGVAPWNKGAGWEPIGNSRIDTWSESFRGSLDGDEHSILNVFINRPTEDYVGVFGQAYRANFLDVSITGAQIYGKQKVGALAGEVVAATLRNCFASGYVSGSVSVGGLVGMNLYPFVYNSGTEGVVEAEKSGGGLIGHVYANGEQMIEDSYSHVAVSGQSELGGLIGRFSGNCLMRSYATGDVSGSGSQIGGLVGYARDGWNKLIENCYSTGNVEGNARVGGLMGEGYEIDIIQCYATGAVNGNEYVGGFSGLSHAVEYIDSFSIGNVVGESLSGGFGGLFIFSAYTTNVYSTFVPIAPYTVDPFLSGNGIYGTSAFWRLSDNGEYTSSYGVGLDGLEFNRRSSFESAGYDFDNIWGIVEGETSPYLITIPLQIRVMADKPAHGSVSGNTTTYCMRTESVSAVAAVGYIFSHWTERGETVSTEADYSFQVETHRDLIAHFILGHKLRYSAETGGDVTGELSQDIVSGGLGSPVSAVPETGLAFRKWSDGVIENPRQDENVTADLNVSAQFETLNQTPLNWYELHNLAPGDGQNWNDLDLIDHDGDGVTTANEFIFDTDPTNPTSRFTTILSRNSADDNFKINFPTSPGRMYLIQYSDTLAPDSWHTLVPEFEGTGSNHSHTDDTISGSTRFYRVKVRMAE
ncbi:hypothetical protein DDZ13_02390 [Coraliomargarita sinensis]|uniref:Uncharacterized protein n=1 Tax=Coraliomargarita sinensis TaxID=2174842 RepID=A0A317ZPF4_9BACT|nr:GLUG motif-containing protein [Coraliomargarita sinensis]PXA05739.1 hypothetical protein DDZ13_02390 [Coraliomargarita sinensis]